MMNREIQRKSTRFKTYVIALLCLALFIGCAPGERNVGQEMVTTSAEVTTDERSSGSLIETPTPAATSTETMTLAASQTPSRLPTATPEAATALPPTSTVTSTPTHTSTPAPTASKMPGTARPTTEAIANPGALAELGLRIYQEQYCGICHQLDVAETAGMFGPTHDDIAHTAEQRIQDPKYTGEATTAEEYIRESILSPELYVVEGYEHTQHHMPAYTNLSGTDLAAIVQLLLQQK